MGSCQSHNIDYCNLQDIVGLDFDKDNYTPDKKASLVEQALTIIEKYKDLPNSETFPWNYRYKDKRHDVNADHNVLYHSGSQNILYQAVMRGNYQIALELVKTGKFDDVISTENVYSIGHHHQFTYHYYLIDYLAFQLFNCTKMHLDLVKKGGVYTLKIPEYFRSNRNIEQADQLGKWLVEFYASKRPCVLTGYSTFCSIVWHTLPGYYYHEFSMLLKCNIFTFTTIFDMPLTRKAILDKVPEPKFIFEALLLIGNIEKWYQDSPTWKVIKDLGSVNSNSFPYLETTFQQIQTMEKPNLSTLFNDIYRSMATNHSSNYGTEFRRDTGNLSSRHALFFFTRMHQIYDLKVDRSKVLGIWEHLLKKLNFQSPTVCGKLLELFTDAYLAQVNPIYLTHLVPYLMEKQWDPVLEQMKRMGVLISQPIYHLLLQGGSCKVAQMIIQENLHWINVPDNCKRTAIHWGLSHQKHDFVKFLLSQKADVHVIDQHGDTPFILACQTDDDSLAHQIYEAQTNKPLLQHRNLQGKIAFFYLCQKKHERMIDIMANNGEIPLEMVDLELNTPLHYAVKHLDDSALMIKIIKLFSKEHLMKKNCEGKTAYQILETRTDLKNYNNVMTFWRSHQG